MDDNHRNILIKSASYLRRHLDVNDDLLAELRSHGILEDEDIEPITLTYGRDRPMTGKVDKLLKVLPRRGKNAFSQLRRALEQSSLAGNKVLADNLRQAENGEGPLIAASNNEDHELKEDCERMDSHMRRIEPYQRKDLLDRAEAWQAYLPAQDVKTKSGKRIQLPQPGNEVTLNAVRVGIQEEEIDREVKRVIDFTNKINARFWESEDVPKAEIMDKNASGCGSTRLAGGEAPCFVNMSALPPETTPVDAVEQTECYLRSLDIIDDETTVTQHVCYMPVTVMSLQGGHHLKSFDNQPSVLVRILTDTPKSESSYRSAAEKKVLENLAQLLGDSPLYRLASHAHAVGRVLIVQMSASAFESLYRLSARHPGLLRAIDILGVSTVDGSTVLSTQFPEKDALKEQSADDAHLVKMLVDVQDDLVGDSQALILEQASYHLAVKEFAALYINDEEPGFLKKLLDLLETNVQGNKHYDRRRSFRIRGPASCSSNAILAAAGDEVSSGVAADDGAMTVDEDKFDAKSEDGSSVANRNEVVAVESDVSGIVMQHNVTDCADEATDPPDKKEVLPKVTTADDHQDDPKVTTAADHQDDPKVTAGDDHQDDPKVTAAADHQDDPKVTAAADHQDDLGLHGHTEGGCTAILYEEVMLEQPKKDMIAKSPDHSLEDTMSVTKMDFIIPEVEAADSLALEMSDELMDSVSEGSHDGLDDFHSADDGSLTESEDGDGVGRRQTAGFAGSEVDADHTVNDTASTIINEDSPVHCYQETKITPRDGGPMAPDPTLCDTKTTYESSDYQNVPPPIQGRRLAVRRPVRRSLVTPHAKDVDVAVCVEHQLWFHGRISRNRADAMIVAEGTDGCFLVRRRRESDGSGNYALSVMAGNQPRHMIIHQDVQEFWYLDSTQPYPSIPGLVKAYSRIHVPFKSTMIPQTLLGIGLTGDDQRAGWVDHVWAMIFSNIRETSNGIHDSKASDSQDERTGHSEYTDIMSGFSATSPGRLSQRAAAARVHPRPCGAPTNLRERWARGRPRLSESRERRDLPSFINEDLSLVEQPWYYGNIDRDETEERLENSGDGYFLVRKTKIESMWLLSFREQGECWHLEIGHNTSDDGYVLGDDTLPFTDVVNLVRHYTQYELPTGIAEKRWTLGIGLWQDDHIRDHCKLEDSESTRSGGVQEDGCARSNHGAFKRQDSRYFIEAFTKSVRSGRIKQDWKPYNAANETVAEG